MSTPIPLPDVPPAHATQILCAAWAAPSDIPESARVGITDGQWEQVLMMASEILYRLSGYQWRGEGCTATATLRSRPAAIGANDWTHASCGVCECWGYNGYSQWTDWSSWGPIAGYGGYHPRPRAVPLEADARAIVEVRSGGVVLAPTAYRVSRSGWLERIDGDGFAVCGAGGPTEVDYSYGLAPDSSGVRACVLFAMELAKLLCGDDSCAIPATATSVTRQGISIQIDPSGFLDKRRTGLPAVDMWLVSVNPKGRTRSGSVWSPDIPQAEQTYTP
jgi:hypothetical protein